MQKVLFSFCIIFGFLACNNAPTDAIPLKVPEDQMALHAQLTNEITRLMEEDSVQWDAVIALSDSAQATFWYAPEVFVSEAFAWYNLGEMAKADSVFTHIRNLYDRRLRQRADFSDAVNRAFVSGCLYGSEAFVKELDSLAKLKVYQANSEELKMWRDILPETIELLLGNNE